MFCVYAGRKMTFGNLPGNLFGRPLQQRAYFCSIFEKDSARIEAQYSLRINFFHKKNSCDTLTIFLSGWLSQTVECKSHLSVNLLINLQLLALKMVQLAILFSELPEGFSVVAQLLLDS
jgi:hypothetical protein